MKKKETQAASEPEEAAGPPPPRKGSWAWPVLLLFASAWMFVLGVLVGRGTAPVRFDIEKMHKELGALREAVIKKEQDRYKIDLEALVNQKDLGFYDALKSNREPPPIPDAPAEPRPRPEPARAQVPPQAPVNPEPVKPPEKKTESPPAAFTIQTAAFKDSKIAGRTVEGLKKKGYPAYVSPSEIPGKGVWYRVRVGGFSSREEAQNVLDRLKKEKLKPMVVRQQG
jgi:cell division septation protein DedD